MQKYWASTLILVALFGASPSRAERVTIPVPHLAITGTAGLWRWDERSLLDGSYDSDWTPVFGGRLGYGILESLTIEAIVLHGSNSVRGADPGSDDVSLTQLELSGVVFFRGLSERGYPYVSLGAGYSFRGGDPTIEGDPVNTPSRPTFHLGVGARFDLSPKSSIRVLFRDTFYPHTNTSRGGTEFSEVLDSVELSGSFEYRIPLGKVRRSERLR